MLGRTRPMAYCGSHAATCTTNGPALIWPMRFSAGDRPCATYSSSCQAVFCTPSMSALPTRGSHRSERVRPIPWGTARSALSNIIMPQACHSTGFRTLVIVRPQRAIVQKPVPYPVAIRYTYPWEDWPRLHWLRCHLRAVPNTAVALAMIQRMQRLHVAAKGLRS